MAPDGPSKRKKLQDLQALLQRGDLLAAQDLLGQVGQGAGKPASPGSSAEEAHDDDVAGPPAEPPWPGAEEAAAEAGEPAEGLGADLPAGPLSPQQVGLESVEDGGDALWRLALPLGEVLPGRSDTGARFRSVLRGAGQQFDELAATPGLCHAANARPEEVGVLRLYASFAEGEVEGLFACGWLELTETGLGVQIDLADGADGERALLAAAAERLESAGVLVTFDAAKRDWPWLKARWEASGLAEPWAYPPELDVLAEARARWKTRLRTRQLANLEKRLLGLDRHGEALSDRMLACQYQRFADTGDARHLVAVLRSIAWDLASLAELAAMLLSGEEPPGIGD